MRRRIVLGLIVAAVLTGCALPRERAGAGMRWGLESVTAKGARLALGVPGTDDVRMILTCRSGSEAIDVTVVGRAGDGAVVELQSGEVVGRYAGAGHVDEESLGGLDIDLKIPVSDPVLASFAETGKLTIVFTQRQVRLPNGFAPAHDFMRLCARPEVGAGR
jgi:hypothetical protein